MTLRGFGAHYRDLIRYFALTINTLIALPILAAGTGSTGGGNLAEADFTSSARWIQTSIDSNPESAAQILRVEGIAAHYLSALDTTKVQCTFGKYTKKLRALNKIAYFEAESNSIYLDCSRYNQIKQSGEIKFMLIFHEYMRKLGLEDSDYRISSNLPRFLAAHPINAKTAPSKITCPSGHIYSPAFGVCLYRGECGIRILAQSPRAPSMCVNIETGLTVGLQRCGVGFLLTSRGCFTGEGCSSGLAKYGDRCIETITDPINSIVKGIFVPKATERD